jgi:transposase
MKGLEGLKKRTFDRTACGLSIDRDDNAALNLRRPGSASLGSFPYRRVSGKLRLSERKALAAATPWRNRPR